MGKTKDSKTNVSSRARAVLQSATGAVRFGSGKLEDSKKAKI